MLLFWLLAGGLAAVTALLVSLRAAAAARRAARPDEDPALPLHRRQLHELDALAERGQLGPAELAAARAEAGRRLLRAADRRVAPLAPGGRGSRLAVTVAAATAAGVALALYLAIGRPGVPDQPYAQRLKSWRRADPSALEPAQMAAVLDAIAAERPHDPQVFDYLGRAELAAGQPGEAARAFARASALDPGNAELPAEEGEALTIGSEGKVSPQAEAAFREALRRDPKSPAARFHLAQLRMSRGDVPGGLADWRALLADLPPSDPRRAALQGAIAQASAPSSGPAPAALSGGPSAEQVAAAAQGLQAGGGDQAAFIRGMVDRLAARLKTSPDDVDGWARLVRAYKVLGDKAAEDRAIEQARAIYAKRPADMARIEAER